MEADESKKALTLIRRFSKPVKHCMDKLSSKRYSFILQFLMMMSKTLIYNLQ